MGTHTPTPLFEEAGDADEILARGPVESDGSSVRVKGL